MSADTAVRQQVSKRPRAAVHGAAAGLFGGGVSAAVLTRFGSLQTVASAVGVHAVAPGLLLYLLIAVTVGAGLGVVVRARHIGAGETVLWGLGYATAWWYLGTLALLPLVSGAPVSWNVAAARTALPLLLAHLLYGATTALALAADRLALRGVPRGLLVGLVAVWLMTTAIPASGPLLRASHPWWWLYGLGAPTGIVCALLTSDPLPAAGPAAVRGAGHGLLLWLAGPLTAVPLLTGNHPLWSADALRAGFAALPAYLLLGVLATVLHTGTGRFTRLLFAAPADRTNEEGPGARTLRAVARGTAAGVVGGLLFTVVMVQIGYLGTVARLVGSTTPGVGFVVHLAISMLLGASYGLLFRRQSHDLMTGVGWGVAYGFLWWIAGALTILPLWLGGDPQWSITGATAAFPSLVGHLVYGAGLGATFHLVEARHDPWWLRRATAGPLEMRAVRRQVNVESAAPAVWALPVVVMVTLTVVLGR